jgi:hypothetical protein
MKEPPPPPPPSSPFKPSPHRKEEDLDPEEVLPPQMRESLFTKISAPATIEAINQLIDSCGIATPAFSRDLLIQMIQNALRLFGENRDLGQSSASRWLKRGGCASQALPTAS